MRYFVSIVRTGSLAAAARDLHLSPAALSKAMRLLQEEVGFELMLPAGRGILITQEGKQLAREAEALLAQFDRLPLQARGQSRGAHQLRFGSFEVFTTYLMGELAQELEKEAELIVHELIPGKIEEALIENRIDVGLTYQPIYHRDLDHLEIGKVRMGVYGIKKVFAQKSLEHLPFAVPAEPLQGVPTKAQGLDGWQNSFGERVVRFKVSLMETALELSRRGLCVAYLPGFVVDIHNSMVLPEHRLSEVYIPTRGSRSAQVYLVKRKNESEGPFMKKIGRSLRRKMS